MATKQQVLKVIAKQVAAGHGTQYEMYGSDHEIFDVWLPDGFVWASGYNMGLVSQEKDPSESWSNFWAGIMVVIGADVIPDPNRK